MGDAADTAALDADPVELAQIAAAVAASSGTSDTGADAAVAVASSEAITADAAVDAADAALADAAAVVALSEAAVATAVSSSDAATVADAAAVVALSEAALADAAAASTSAADAAASSHVAAAVAAAPVETPIRVSHGGGGVPAASVTPPLYSIYKEKRVPEVTDAAVQAKIDGDPLLMAYIEALVSSWKAAVAAEQEEIDLRKAMEAAVDQLKSDGTAAIRQAQILDARYHDAKRDLHKRKEAHDGEVAKLELKLDMGQADMASLEDKFDNHMDAYRNQLKALEKQNSELALLHADCERKTARIAELDGAQKSAAKKASSTAAKIVELDEALKSAVGKANLQQRLADDRLHLYSTCADELKVAERSLAITSEACDTAEKELAISQNETFNVAKQADANLRDETAKHEAVLSSNEELLREALLSADRQKEALDELAKQKGTEGDSLVAMLAASEAKKAIVQALELESARLLSDLKASRTEKHQLVQVLKMVGENVGQVANRWEERTATLKQLEDAMINHVEDMKQTIINHEKTLVNPMNQTPPSKFANQASTSDAVQADLRRTVQNLLSQIADLQAVAAASPAYMPTTEVRLPPPPASSTVLPPLPPPDLPPLMQMGGTISTLPLLQPPNESPATVTSSPVNEVLFARSGDPGKFALIWQGNSQSVKWRSSFNRLVMEASSRLDMTSQDVMSMLPLPTELLWVDAHLLKTWGDQIATLPSDTLWALSDSELVCSLKLRLDLGLVETPEVPSAFAQAIIRHAAVASATQDRKNSVEDRMNTTAAEPAVNVSPSAVVKDLKDVRASEDDESVLDNQSEAELSRSEYVTQKELNKEKLAYHLAMLPRDAANVARVKALYEDAVDSAAILRVLRANNDDTGATHHARATFRTSMITDWCTASEKAGRDRHAHYQIDEMKKLEYPNGLQVPSSEAAREAWKPFRAIIMDIIEEALKRNVSWPDILKYLTQSASNSERGNSAMRGNLSRASDDKTLHSNPCLHAALLINKWDTTYDGNASGRGSLSDDYNALVCRKSDQGLEHLAEEIIAAFIKKVDTPGTTGTTVFATSEWALEINKKFESLMYIDTASASRGARNVSVFSNRLTEETAKMQAGEYETHQYMMLSCTRLISVYMLSSDKITSEDDTVGRHPEVKSRQSSGGPSSAGPPADSSAWQQRAPGADPNAGSRERAKDGGPKDRDLRKRWVAAHTAKDDRQIACIDGLLVDSPAAGLPFVGALPGAPVIPPAPMPALGVQPPATPPWVPPGHQRGGGKGKGGKGGGNDKGGGKGASKGAGRGGGGGYSPGAYSNVPPPGSTNPSTALPPLGAPLASPAPRFQPPEMGPMPPNCTIEQMDNLWVEHKKLQEYVRTASANQEFMEALGQAWPCEAITASCPRPSVDLRIPRMALDNCKYCHNRPRAPAGSPEEAASHAESWRYGTGNGGHNPHKCWRWKGFLVRGGDATHNRFRDHFRALLQANVSTASHS